MAFPQSCSLDVVGRCLENSKFLVWDMLSVKKNSRTCRHVSAPVFLRAGDLDSRYQGVLHTAVGSSVLGVPGEAHREVPCLLHPVLLLGPLFVCLTACCTIKVAGLTAFANHSVSSDSCRLAVHGVVRIGSSCPPRH